MSLRRWGAQTRMELALVSRNGESLLLTLALPVMILVFFSVVDVLPTGSVTGDPVDFLAPGVLALAVMSSALVNLAIGTGFDRQYGVLKRLGATPLTRLELLAAKVAVVLVVEAVQLTVLVLVGVALGWSPGAGLGLVIVGSLLATVGFAGIGLTLAGTLPGLVALAAANGLYFVLLLSSGMIIPLDELPGSARPVLRLLPSTALADIAHGAVGANGSLGARPWLVLAAWGLVAPLVASRLFTWEPAR